jgi:hypothetical protein
MTPENFIYWLQGMLDISETKELNEKQVQIIKDHIALVLKKETPQHNPLIGRVQLTTCFKCGKCPCSCNSLLTTPLINC